MLRFLKENGFPADLTFDTEPLMDPNHGGFHSKVIDGEGNVIKEFDHKEMRSRLQWADGYFTALRLNNNK
jgi:hypothetical protein